MATDIIKTYESKFQVPFYDLDPMRVVWHGNYFKYFDVARDGLFDQLGVDFYSFFKNTNYLFPVIRNSIKHIYPLRHREKFITKATLVDVKFKILIDFEIRLADNGKVCAKGKSEQAAVKYPEMEIMYNIPNKIRVAMGF